MSFFPRFGSGEFTPLFRLLDDYASHQSTRPCKASFAAQPVRTFQPRFDVKEIKDGYQLEGELPGIDQKDVNIEFTDPQTIKIRGHTTRMQDIASTPAVETHEDQASVSNSHQATVEDESSVAKTDAGGEEWTEVAKEAKQSETQQMEQPVEQKAHYWVSERPVGEFQRTFNFPTRLDQEGVKASLKNGILSILVPKAQIPASRRINIE